MTAEKHKIAVVIPCYKVVNYILEVLNKIGEEVTRIYVVDDCCPEESGEFVRNSSADNRITVIRCLQNKGVGGAVILGYQRAIADGADVIVKLDGDGQMDPSLIPDFVRPILEGKADYTKGNRFYDLQGILLMPKVRIFGNAVLSFLTKLSSGYWNLFDPTNGYTAIHRNVAIQLPFDRISNRYFFETDMLFRLNSLRAVVVDIPMDARYGNEQSNLKISNILLEFIFKHLQNFVKRIFYNYYLRDMSLASIELPVGILLLILGAFYGSYNWIISIKSGVPSSAGTVMAAGLPLILGLQFVLSFLNYDINSVPSRPIQHNKHTPRVTAAAGN